MYMYLGTQNYELVTAKCDMSQEPTGTVNSRDYYSTIEDQPYAKQTDNNNVVHKVSENLCCKLSHVLFNRTKFLIMKLL